MPANAKRGSRSQWGWIAFGAGVAVCVIAGGVLGAMLGQEDGSEGVDSGTVAALALDARSLSEDARSLSSAFESALAREALEGEAATLRTELQRLDRRAARIRARARADVEAARGEGVSPAIWRGLRGIRRTVDTFERGVVGRLETIVGTPARPVAAVTESDGAVEEALADVTLALEDQDRTLAALTEDLERPVGDDRGLAGSDEEKLVSGGFEGALLASGQTLAFDYELTELEPEVRFPGAESGEAEISSSAVGGLTVANMGRRSERIDLPDLRLLLFWRHADLPIDAFVERDPCRYEVEEERYCALIGLRFEEGATGGVRSASGRLALPPGGEVVLARLTADPVSVLVAADAAERVADIVSSLPPDLVQVLADGEGDDLAPACAMPDEAESGSEAVALGLLDGDGEVIFESAGTDPTAHIGEDGYGSPPECYAVPPDSA